MAAPNLYLSTNTVNGRTTPLSLGTTTETTLVTNAANSNKSFKLRAITLNNTTTSGTVDVTLRYYNAASGGTAVAFPAITLPVGGSVIAVGTENVIFLEEDRRITIQASAASAASAFVSYEEVTT